MGKKTNKQKDITLLKDAAADFLQFLTTSKQQSDLTNK